MRNLRLGSKLICYIPAQEYTRGSLSIWGEAMLREADSTERGRGIFNNTKTGVLSQADYLCQITNVDDQRLIALRWVSTGAPQGIIFLPFAFQTDSLIEDLRRYAYAESLVCHCVRRSGCKYGEYGYHNAHHQHPVVRKDRRKDRRKSGYRKSERGLLTRSLFFRAQNNALNESCNEKEEIHDVYRKTFLHSGGYLRSGEAQRVGHPLDEEGIR